ncbi:MAG TPA: diguanylate cyclase [Nitrospiria bacterium]|nr:diguanylate cyclase [Nitrospiria bacterium]
MESLEVSRLKQIQEAFSALTGFSLFTYDAQGSPVCEPSLENPICQIIQKTPKGLEHCKSHCGKSIGRALQSGEPVFFKCDVGLHVFSIPMILKDRDDKSNPPAERAGMVLLGGKTFFTPDEFSVCREGSKQLDVPPEELSRLSDEIRVVDHQLMVSAARFLESVLPYLFATLHEKNLTASKLARLLTLFNLTSEFKEERSFKHLAPSLLNTLGILFGLHTASVMVLDPRERQFKPEAVFGQKANLIAASSMESASGLVGLLQEKASPVESRDTMEILKTGLPAEIASLHLFPLLLQNSRITGILAIFDTPLTEEEVGIIQAFCQQFAVCQENRGLRAERQDLAKDVSVLLEIAKTVGSALDSEDLFGIILEKSTEFLEAEQGSLMLLDEDRRELTVKAMKGLNKKIVELLKIRPGEGISGKVLATGTPMVVSDIESDGRIAQEKRPRYKTKSFISIPLKLNDRTIGVLNIADKITGEVFKEDDLHLLVSIGAYASVAIERSKFYHKTEELKKISITDSLTGLLNRRYFQERMAEEIERSRRHHLPLSLIMMDIDNFKSVNDTYGHLVGDEALKITARAIRNCVRTIDVAARYGGEEFTVILPQTAKSDATVIAERICSEVSRLDFPFEQAARKLSFSVSLGLATFPDDAEALDDLIRNTDIALYQAKAQGKNRVVIYNKREEQG